MSDSGNGKEKGKKDGTAQITKLVTKARNHFKDPEDTPKKESDEHLELDVPDPTTEQETPPVLHEGDLGEGMELNEQEEERPKGGFLARMSMVQRVILFCLIAVVIIGLQRTMTGRDDIAYLDQDPEGGSSQESAPDPTSDMASMDDPIPPAPSSDGFEPIDQGSVSPDTNAIDLTIDPDQAEENNAFSEDAMEPETGPASQDLAQQDATEAPGSDSPETAGFSGGMGGMESVGDPDSFGSDGLSAVSFDEAAPQTPDEIGTDPGGFGPAPDNESLPISDDEFSELQKKVASLNSEFDSLSQSVASIRGEVSKSAATNKQLASEVSNLMDAFEDQEQRIRDLDDRPTISDLVIFRAANNCNTCVPHALFIWNDQEVEVGDGLEWHGFNVAIRGDRMSLRKGDDVYHYWYR